MPWPLHGRFRSFAIASKGVEVNLSIALMLKLTPLPPGAQQQIARSFINEKIFHLYQKLIIDLYSLN